MTPAIQRFDAAIDAAFDRVRADPSANRVFYTASAAAEFSLLWHALGWSRVVMNHDRLPDAVRLSAVLGAESLLVNQGIKRLFARPRPIFEGERPHHFRIPLTSSFPSGHASAAFCAAGVLSAQDGALTPVWYALAAVVATSRIHVKIHHASDVLGGAFVGTALGLAARAIVRRI